MLPYTCQNGYHQKEHTKCWWERGEKAALIHCWWEGKLVQSLWKIVWRTWLCAQCFCALCNSSLDSVRRGCLKKKFLFCFKWRRVLPKVKYLVNIELGLNLGWEIFILPIFLSTQLIAFLDKWMDGWMDELHKGYLCVPWKSSFFLGNSKRHAFYLKEQLPGTFCRHDGNAGWGGGCAALGQLQGHKAGF